MYLFQRSVVKRGRSHLEFDDENNTPDKNHHIGPLAHAGDCKLKVNPTNGETNQRGLQDRDLLLPGVALLIFKREVVSSGKLTKYLVFVGFAEGGKVGFVVGDMQRVFVHPNFSPNPPSPPTPITNLCVARVAAT